MSAAGGRELALAMRQAAAEITEVGGLLERVDARARAIRRRRNAAVAAAGTLVAAGVAVLLSGLPGGQGDGGTATVRPAAPSARATPTQTRRGDPAERDDFTGRSLDRRRWAYVYDGGRSSPFGAWSAGDVTVSGGALRLSVTRTGSASPVATSGGVGAASAPARTGRWEVRWRMPRAAAPGTVGQFGLVAAATAGTPGTRLPHLATLDPAKGTLTFTEGPGDRAEVVRLDPSRWHTVAVEVTGGSVRWLLDGRQVLRRDAPEPEPVWPALQTLLAGPDCGADPLPADCGGSRAAFPQTLVVDRYRFWRASP